MQTIHRCIILCAVTYLTGIIAANSASFDCSKAPSSAAKLICNDEKLSALDSALGDVYREKVAKFPELRSQQREWISARDKYCNLPENVDDVDELRPHSPCLAATITKRTRELRSASVETPSGFVLPPLPEEVRNPTGVDSTPAPAAEQPRPSRSRESTPRPSVETNSLVGSSCDTNIWVSDGRTGRNFRRDMGSFFSSHNAFALNRAYDEFSACVKRHMNTRKEPGFCTCPFDTQTKGDWLVSYFEVRYGNCAASDQEHIYDSQLDVTFSALTCLKNNGWQRR
ncbi:lysozyme inhibitor LprI family protein [Xanthobacter sp. V3C-3]|uniref:lysozyme inhibitor LprI family protein n=1 Tax=Xanthobacter lutulentifluminis TaxID=3119935 RepID=UPI0037278AFD